MDRDQKTQLLKTFGVVKPTPQALQEYCKRHGITPISTDQYEDLVFANKRDERTGKVFNLIMSILSKLQFTPDYILKTDLDKILDDNENIEFEIIGKMYEYGITYREHDAILDAISTYLDHMLTSIKNRNNNMASRTLQYLGEDKFGTDDFKLADMADYQNQRVGNDVSVIESKNKKKKTQKKK